MQRIHENVAIHLGHARPIKPEGKRDLKNNWEFVSYDAAIKQHELDTLMTMEALALGGRPLDRGEFLRRIARQVEVDARDRREGAPPEEC